MLRYSIVICTFNGRTRLAKTLSSIRALEYSATSVEVLVIDNASTDGTADYVRRQWIALESQYPLFVFSESQQGLSYARWRGIHEAKGEFVVFCDDDNRLAPDYLRVADQTLGRFGEKIIIGSAGIPEFEEGVTPPAHFYAYACQYAVGTQSRVASDISASRGWVYGAGAIFPRSALVELNSLGFKSALSDRRGNTLSSGGDVELCLVLNLLNWKIISQPDLQFMHYIPTSRLAVEYIARLEEENYKSCSQVLDNYSFLPHLKNLRSRGARFKSFLRLCAGLLRHPTRESFKRLVFLTLISAGMMDGSSRYRKFAIRSCIVPNRTAP